ncbi:pentapeptide repeat-containing protein [Bacillus pumilus]|uniref:pentapeptide repeat-containing protein n=1 Tax=Bacillus pumilus TaxID=1408 RepID=UPI0013748951|nr:pentapeptide repeat-containing protein [Bacillus pumilus]QHQ75761.1 hypothetical protein GPS65_06410 [Bacillus pumilus]
MNFKENKEMNREFTNKVFSYRNKTHISKNFSRKDFSKSWNVNVIFENTIFEQTNFDYSRIENCTFINCIFKNCFLVKTQLIDSSFKNCTFDNLSLDRCNIQSSRFIDNTYNKTFLYPNFKKTSKGFKVTEIEFNTVISVQLKKALETALKNEFIRHSNTLFLKKSQHLNTFQKRSLRKITPKEAKKLGLSKKERLEENRRRKKEKKQWLLNTYKDSLEGKNRKISKSALNVLTTNYNEQQLICGLEFAAHSIIKKFNNLSYLIKVIDEITSKK